MQVGRQLHREEAERGTVSRLRARVLRTLTHFQRRDRQGKEKAGLFDLELTRAVRLGSEGV